MDIEILYEDGEALVINKPAGLPVDRPKRGGPALWDHIEQLKLGFQRPPVAVHRLDTDTSGCLILARNPKALKRFNKAFEDRLVGKTYLAVMDFEPEEQSGTIALNLAKISSAEKGWRMIAAKKGKPAVSHWELLQTIGEGERKRSLIRFRPETGRTHQLRVHALQGLGVPLLGDPVYGPVRGQNKGAPRTMLHAEAIHMTRPGKDPVSAYAPFPEDFIRAGVTPPEPPPPPERTPVAVDG